MFEALLGLAAWATLSLGCVANPTPHPALDDTTASNNADVASGFADSASPAASDASQEGADASAPLPDAGPPPRAGRWAGP